MHKLTEELSLPSDKRGIVFTVDSPYLKGEQTIDRDDEEGFRLFKGHIAKRIRSQHLSKDTVFEVEIEPIGEKSGNE